MTYFHKCPECRTCPNCLTQSCGMPLTPDEGRIRSSIEDGWIVKRCPHCNAVIEKFESLELLNSK